MKFTSQVLDLVMAFICLCNPYNDNFFWNPSIQKYQKLAAMLGLNVNLSVICCVGYEPYDDLYLHFNFNFFKYNRKLSASFTMTTDNIKTLIVDEIISLAWTSISLFLVSQAFIGMRVLSPNLRHCNSRQQKMSTVDLYTTCFRQLTTIQPRLSFTF